MVPSGDQRITAHAAASALPHSTQRWLQVTQLDGNGGDSTGGRGFVLAPFTQITSQVDRTALRGIGTMPYYFVLWHTLWCSRIPRGTLWHRLLGRSLWNECISSSVSPSVSVGPQEFGVAVDEKDTNLLVPLSCCPT